MAVPVEYDLPVCDVDVQRAVEMARHRDTSNAWLQGQRIERLAEPLPLRSVGLPGRNVLAVESWRKRDDVVAIRVTLWAVEAQATHRSGNAIASGRAANDPSRSAVDEMLPANAQELGSRCSAKTPSRIDHV